MQCQSFFFIKVCIYPLLTRLTNTRIKKNATFLIIFHTIAPARNGKYWLLHFSCISFGYLFIYLLGYLYYNSIPPQSPYPLPIQCTPSIGSSFLNSASVFVYSTVPRWPGHVITRPHFSNAMLQRFSSVWVITSRSLPSLTLWVFCFNLVNTA